MDRNYLRMLDNSQLIEMAKDGDDLSLVLAERLLKTELENTEAEEAIIAITATLNDVAETLTGLVEAHS